MKATETYQSRRTEIDVRLGQIQILLTQLDQAQANDSRNWEFAGTAGHIKAQLDEIITSLIGDEA